MSKTVVVGMSGGVDSSVTAALLQEQGYNVIGLFMNNWDTDSECCPAVDDWRDVSLVCGKLGIKHYSVNFSAEYMRDVFEYFLQELKFGRTPNPDVLCNRQIKFGVFKDYARKLGADLIATGHYCGISDCYSVPFVANSGNALMRAKDANKDQSYFLNQVSTKQLDNVMFPLCGLHKSDVRELAHRYGLPTSDKKDSTGICFIGERNFRQFLSAYLPMKQGDIVDITTNRVVGVHTGLMGYTIGQRRGLGIGGQRAEAKPITWGRNDSHSLYSATHSTSLKPSINVVKDSRAVGGSDVGNATGLDNKTYNTTAINRHNANKSTITNNATVDNVANIKADNTTALDNNNADNNTADNAGGRWFVVRKSLADNKLYVSQDETIALSSRGCTVDSLNIIGGKLARDRFDCTAKFRYRGSDVAVSVEIRNGEQAHIAFASPQRAVTEGQYAVLYSGDRCIGGGRIVGVDK